MHETLERIRRKNRVKHVKHIQIIPLHSTQIDGVKHLVEHEQYLLMMP
jgi:hypothetical protein